MSKIFALIFAGGMGVRMNAGALPKQFITLHGKPILVHTLEKFERNKNIDGIILVMLKDWIEYTKELLRKYHIQKVKAIANGGDCGQMSIYNGLCAAQSFYGNEDIVLIHDGVRPLIDDRLIDRNIECVKKNGSAISSSRVAETVFLAEDGYFGRIVDRNRVWLAKAPQSFYFSEIMQAHKRAISEGKKDFVDSSNLMQYYGHSLATVECDNENIKITTPTDYYVFRAIFEKKENEQLL